MAQPIPAIWEAGSKYFYSVLVSNGVYTNFDSYGVYTNFDSFSPDYYKFGLMYTLLCRAYNICSSFEFFHNEIVKIKSFLQKNG